MKDPVSVVIATRDRADLLRRAVSSVLSQDYEGHIGCVVVYDQAEPEELGDLERSGSRSILVTRNTRTPGLAGARNSGVEVASGALLAFCDDDDEWLPHKLSRQTDAMGGASVAVTGIEVVFGGSVTRRIPEGPVTLDGLIAGRDAAIHPSTLLVRREAWERIGPVDEEIPGSYGEDYEWLLRAAALEPIAVAPEPLVRVHWGGSLFADRWQTIADAISYLLEKHPELRRSRANLARLYGRVAFAHSAMGHRREALGWALRSAVTRPLEPRPYLAVGVAMGLLDARKIQAKANRSGRGI